MKSRFKILFFVVALLIQGFNFGQSNSERHSDQNINGLIEGKVFDGLNRNPLEYANVILFSSKDSSMVMGVASNSAGVFTFENLKPGSYFLKISFMGYEPYVSDRIVISPRSQNVQLGTIELKPKEYILQQAVVSGQKMEMNYSLDKKIINVDKTIAATGGTVVDVLENAPSVKVDADGNISLRGNPNVTILINGRISGLTAFGGSEALSSIPASSVERIEIVTNPSARYEAEGTSGIINIVLKKSESVGFNGQLNLNAGYGDRYNSTLSTNLKYGAWNLSINYDARMFNFNGSGTTFRKTEYNSISSSTLQTNNSRNENFGHNGFFGFDYSLDSKTSLAGSFSFRRFNPEYKSFFVNQNFDLNNQVIRFFDRKTEGERLFASNNYNLNFKKEYDAKGQELSLDFNLSTNQMERDEKIYQNEWDPAFSGTILKTYSQKTKSKNNNREIAAQIDYAHPLEDGSKFETGLRYSDKLLKTNNYYYDLISNAYIENLSLRNNFNYDEQILASYLIYNTQFSDFKIQAGIRAEQTFINTKLIVTGEKNYSEYLSLFPSAHLSYSFSKNDEARFSYSRRVDRPSNRQLNPIVDYSDSLNLFRGNPKLKPQYINSYEVGYIKTIGKATINTNLFLRETNDLIGTTTRLINQNVTETTFENLNKGRWMGVEVIYTQTILPFWRASINASYFNVEISDNRNLGNDNSSNSWTLRASNSLFFSKATQFQFTFNYNSPSLAVQQSYRGASFISSQSKTKEMWWIDLAGRQELLEKALSLTLRISDVFNTRKFDVYTKAPNFTIDSKRKMDSRMFFVGLVYNLSVGDSFKPKQIKKENNNDDEM